MPLNDLNAFMIVVTVMAQVSTPALKNCVGVIPPTLIREIPDHATCRGKGVNTGLVRQTWGLYLFGPM